MGKVVSSQADHISARFAGFGFIWDTNSAEIGDVDIFVHWTTIQGEVQFKSLAEGEMVEYDLGRGPKVDLMTRSDCEVSPY